MRGDLRAIFPVVAQLTDQVKRPGDNDGVVRGGSVERIFQSRLPASGTIVKCAAW